MSDSTIGVNVGTDENLHTDERTVGHGQFVHPGESAYPTYSAIASNISIATSAAHVLQIMADGTNYTRLRRVWLTPTDDVPASASVATLQIVRLSTAGTGGSAVTAQRLGAVGTYAGDVRTLPSAKGTEGGVLFQRRLTIPADLTWRIYDPWYASDWMLEAHTFGVDATAGIALKIVTGVASCTIDAVAEFYLTSYA